jgi:hypothetical protein
MADYFDRGNDQARMRELRDMPREQYLRTSWWLHRREVALKKAGRKCAQCGASTRLQVHHLSYDRLGAERDSDLEVLCDPCHEKHHFDESRRHDVRLYLKLARETERMDHPTTFADFKERLRERCNALKVPIDHRIDDAINVVMTGRASLVSETRRQEVAATPVLPPIDKDEAIALLRRLKIQVPFQSIQPAFGVGAGVAMTRARARAFLNAAVCPECQHVGAQLSGVRLGWLFCPDCKHRWEIPLEAIQEIRTG